MYCIEWNPTHAESGWFFKGQKLGRGESKIIILLYDSLCLQPFHPKHLKELKAVHTADWVNGRWTWADPTYFYPTGKNNSSEVYMNIISKVIEYAKLDYKSYINCQTS